MTSERYGDHGLLARIRDAYWHLNDTHRFAAMKEIFAGIDIFNLTGVSDADLERMIKEAEAFCPEGSA